MKFKYLKKDLFDLEEKKIVLEEVLAFTTKLEQGKPCGQLDEDFSDDLRKLYPDIHEDIEAYLKAKDEKQSLEQSLAFIQQMKTNKLEKDDELPSKLTKISKFNQEIKKSIEDYLEAREKNQKACKDYDEFKQETWDFRLATRDPNLLTLFPEIGIQMAQWAVKGWNKDKIMSHRLELFQEKKSTKKDMQKQYHKLIKELKNPRLEASLESQHKQVTQQYDEAKEKLRLNNKSLQNEIETIEAQMNSVETNISRFKKKIGAPLIKLLKSIDVSEDTNGIPKKETKMQVLALKNALDILKQTKSPEDCEAFYEKIQEVLPKSKPTIWHFFDKQEPDEKQLFAKLCRKEWKNFKQKLQDSLEGIDENSRSSLSVI